MVRGEHPVSLHVAAGSLREHVLHLPGRRPLHQSLCVAAGRGHILLVQLRSVAAIVEHSTPARLHVDAVGLAVAGRSVVAGRRGRSTGPGLVSVGAPLPSVADTVAGGGWPGRHS